MFGILGWAIGTNGGPGPLLHTPATAKDSALSWAALFGLQSIVGSQASGCLGQSDWTRYAKTPNAALFGQLVAGMIDIPLVLCLRHLLIFCPPSARVDLHNRRLWSPHNIGHRRDLRHIPLEPLRVAPPRPANLLNSRLSSWDLLRRARIPL